MRVRPRSYRQGSFLHESRWEQKTHEYITPPWLHTALGEFDLDPCAPEHPPYLIATQHYFERGIESDWAGRVWLNPPYGEYAIDWMEKMRDHNHGTALLFSRTDTPMFHRFIFPAASGILFLRRRLKFYKVDGSCGDSQATSPSVLISYGEADRKKLKSSGIEGMFIDLDAQRVMNKSKGV